MAQTGSVFKRHLLMADGTARCGETHPTHTTRVPGKVQCPACIAAFTPDEARHALNAELTAAFATLGAAEDPMGKRDVLRDLYSLRQTLRTNHANGLLDSIEAWVRAQP